MSKVKPVLVEEQGKEEFEKALGEALDAYFPMLSEMHFATRNPIQMSQGHVFGYPIYTALLIVREK